MKVKSVKVEFGVSIATGQNSWIKGTASMEVELDSPNDTTDEAYEKAWARVTHEVGKQVGQFEVEVKKKPQA
jgi:hypothetical protein